MKAEEVIERWRGGLIVSCQAEKDSPLQRPDIIAALAQAAERNGAVGVRIDGPANIRRVREAVSVPVLGIEKIMRDDSDVYITPTFEAAARVHRSGADVIALDGTRRPRPDGETLRDIVHDVRTTLGCAVMADVATFDEGVAAAEEIGVDIIGTTLSGYTAETSARTDAPDYELVEGLTRRVRVPVICEGRLRSPADAQRAFACGAFAVVVGTAITNVDWLVRAYAAAAPLKQRKKAEG